MVAAAVRAASAAPWRSTPATWSLPSWPGPPATRSRRSITFSMPSTGTARRWPSGEPGAMPRRRSMAGSLPIEARPERCRRTPGPSARTPLLPHNPCGPPDMTPGRQGRQEVQGPGTALWRAGSYNISTAAGRLEVEGIVRPPFGIEERTDRETGSRSWAVTHLPSGLAVVTRIRARAVGPGVHGPDHRAGRLGRPGYQRHARAEGADPHRPGPSL